MPYCTRDDVYLLGLSAQAFALAPRPVGSPPSSLAADFNPSSGIVRLVGNGFSPADLVYLLAVTGGSLPGGAEALTYYAPLPLGGDLFQLLATTGTPPTPTGQPLTFSSPGAGWSIVLDSARRLDAHIVEEAAAIDECLTANAPPIKPDPVLGYPQVLVGMNARMAARAAVTSLQIENPAYRKAVDRLFAREKQDMVTLAEWKMGKPINPRPTDQDSIPDNAVRAFAGPDVPWTSGEL